MNQQTSTTTNSPLRADGCLLHAGVRRFGWLGLIIAACICLPTHLLHAQTIDVRREYNVKAASLYGFGRYVTWPASAFASPTEPFIIGICGDAPFGTSLQVIAEKKQIQGRPIQIRQLRPVDDVSGCHILFISDTLGLDHEQAILQQSQGKAILLVGESPGFAERGGHIGFFLSAGSVRFELNVAAASSQKLKFNAKLLSLGARIRSSSNSRERAFRWRR